MTFVRFDTVQRLPLSVRVGERSIEGRPTRPSAATIDSGQRRSPTGAKRVPTVASREKSAERSSPGISSRIHHDRGTWTGEPRIKIDALVSGAPLLDDSPGDDVGVV